ncbi:MAG: IS66 family transposase [Synergistota bacterium]|nr:IS66 family transposase [Synergistota bacterium]
MIRKDVEIRNEIIDLRSQANYWRAQHERAVKREAAWKENACKLEAIVRRQEAQIKEQVAQIDALKAKVVWLQEQVFGRKSEQSKDASGKGKQEGSESSLPSSETGRNRGQQPGAKGHGRRNHDELATQVIEHVLTKDSQHCPYCGLPFKETADTEDSEDVHWEVRLIRRIHKRKRYKRTCHCKGLPRIITAPVPPKLIPKGMFSTGFWVQLLLEKYLHQRPLYRIREALSMEGMRRPSQGTLTGGLKRVGALLQPLYARFLERSRSANHWHMDETRWLVFVEVEGKAGYRWWLWVVVTRDTCVYLLDQTRSAKVPTDHLGEDAEGIISADRYSAYKALGEGIRVAFCWTHVRRDYKRVRDGYKKLRAWGQGWVDRIDKIYRLNNQRLSVRSDPDRFKQQDQMLRKALADMAEVRDEELADVRLHPAQHKVLNSLRKHWQGLMIFVDNPDVPMDNNESERRLRMPVVGRKNYYGSGSQWSGMLSAMLFTIFQTLLLNHINPKLFLLAYFDTCAHNGGKAPENPDEFLPWNLSDEKKAQWRYKEHPT